MQQSQSEIIILRPTSVFLAFLAAQIPENELPSLQLLQTDNTAYVIPKCSSDEATLLEIEKHFPRMFRHEISRWLGTDARNSIETSFLDFLCCFKFEMHSHIILLESEIKAGKQVLVFKPRTVLLQWMKSAVAEQEELTNVMERVNLSNLAENATVMVKNFQQLKDIKTFLTEHYHPIFDTAMSRMCSHADKWPKIHSYQSFCQYFSVEIHTQLIHLPA